MALFTKVVFDIRDTDNAYGDYSEVLDESTRLDTDFTINTSKNIHKNYKRKTTLKQKAFAQILVIQPGRCEDIVNPESFSGARSVLECYQALTIDGGDRYVMVQPEQKAVEVEQAPFVLAAKGIIFRQRGTPYFTTTGNPEGYIS
jgi:hypothetical protein